MFQSSRTASGILARQASSACSPSSASVISKSSPSRMRRATFRMTLESSTTRHVFIATLAPLQAVIDTHFLAAFSCRLGSRRDVEHPIDVENDQQLALEPVHTGRHARESG